MVQPAGRGTGAFPPATGRAAAPTAGRAAGPRDRAAGAAEIPRRRSAWSSSELLAQVGGHRRVVPQRLVQVTRLRPVMSGGQLHERGSQLAAGPLGLGLQGSADT